MGQTRYVATTFGRILVSTTGDPSGDRTPVVMWPSLMMDHRLWSEQVRHLEALGVPTVCVDPPGHGASDPLCRDFTLEECALALEAILDDVGAPRAHLVGNSWGAMTAALFGALRPERIASLVLITGTAGRACWTQRLQFRALITIALVAGGVPRLLSGHVVSVFFSAHTRRTKPEAVRELHAAIERCEPRSIAHAVSSVVINRPDRHQVFSRITAPTVVVSGRHDHVFPPADGERLAAAIPGARSIVIEDAAHLLSAEVPEQISDLVTDHINHEGGQHG